MKHLIATLLFALCFIHQAVAAPVPKEVRDLLKRARIPLSSVAIVVQETDADIPLLSFNADLAMNPASTMKLLTTFAGLEMLGPAYRWKTEVFLDGKLEDGVLYGDLIFKGHGDPKLNIEKFWVWLRELRQRGLRDIRGDVVLDRSYFEAADHDPAKFDSKPTRAYNVGPNALLLNFNALHLRLIPNVESTHAILEPDLYGYSILNRIKTVSRRRCAGGDNYTARLEERNIVLEGSIPKDCGEVDDYFSLLPHREYFFAVFSALWEEMGGTLQGGLRDGVAPIDQMAFSTNLSPPLSEVIRDINKFSNNTMARQLFLTLGMAAFEAGLDRSEKNYQELLPLDDLIALLPSVEGEELATQLEVSPLSLDPLTLPAAGISRSISALQEWLASEHLEFPELVLENGAGLSRTERISAQHLAELLRRADHSRYAAELEASLPILGVDGTMQTRFNENDIAGYAHIKTGLLTGVKSIAGYVKAHSGKRWVIVFLVNHRKASLAQGAMDALIEWLQKQY